MKQHRGDSVSRSRRAKKSASLTVANDGRQHQHETDVRLLEHRLDLPRARQETAQHLADVEQESAEIVEKLAAHQAPGAADDHGAAHAQALPRPAFLARLRPREPLHGGAGDGGGQARGRLEELEGVGGRRRVEHDELVVAVAADFVERQGGRVLLRAGEIGGHVPIEGIREDVATQLGVADLFVDQLGERGLGIDPHGVQGVRRGNAERGGGGGGDRRGLGTEVRQPQGIRQPRCRVDGAHQGAHTFARGNHAERRGRGGLADPARPDAYHGPFARHPPFHRCTRSRRAVTLSGAP